MATKMTFIGAKPAATSGTDVQNAGPQTPSSADQNLANLQAAVDDKSPLAGPGISQDYSTGSIGVGIALSAASCKTVEVGYAGNVLMGRSSVAFDMAQGIVYNTGWKYAANATPVALYEQLAGGHYWFTAVAGVTGDTVTLNPVLVIDTSGNMTPGADNTRTLGSATTRWSTIYAGTGTINTSDAREKTPVTPLTNAEIAAATQLAKEIGTFQFFSALDAKGTDARHHTGMTVQRAMEIMSAEGLNPLRYAFICYDEWPATDTEPAGSRYGFRADELMLFIARGFEARLAALEAK